MTMFFRWFLWLVILTIAGCTQKIERLPPNTAPSTSPGTFPSTSLGSNAVAPLTARLKHYSPSAKALLLGYDFFKDEQWKLVFDKAFGTQKAVAAGPLKVVIYHVNDLHNTVRRSVNVYDADGDQKYHIVNGKQQAEKINVNVLNLLAETVKNEKAKSADNEIVLFVSSGDDHIGSKYDVLYRTDSAARPSMSIPYRYYSQAAMDAAAIGNHELDKGIDAFLSAFNKDAQFPVVSVNLTGAQFSVPGAAIRAYRGLKIAYVGLTVDDEIYASRLEAHEPMENFKAVVTALEEKVDFFVVLSHIGIRGRTDKVNDLQVANYLQQLKTPAVVIGGHTHEEYPRVENRQGPVPITRRVPVVQTGGAGTHLGKLTVTLKKSANGDQGYHLDNAWADLIETGFLHHTLKQSRGYRDEVDGQLDPSLQRQLDQALEVVIGKLEPDISRELFDADMVKNRYLNPSLPLARFMGNALVNHFCHSSQKNIQEMIHCSHETRDCMLVSAFNGSGINGLQGAGTSGNVDLTVGKWVEVMPYADTLFVYKIPSEAFKRLLQENGQRFGRYLQMKDKTRLAVYPPQDVLHFSANLRPVINDGTVSYANALPMDEIVLLATSYVAAGRGGWQAYFGRQGHFSQYLTHDTQLTYRKQIIEYIKSRGSLSVQDMKLDREHVVSPSCELQ